MSNVTVRQKNILHNLLIYISPKRYPQLNIQTVTPFGYEFSIHENFEYNVILFKNDLEKSLNDLNILEYFDMKMYKISDYLFFSYNLKEEYRNREAMDNFIALCELKGIKINDHF